MLMSGIPSPLVLDLAEVVFTHFLWLCPYFVFFKMSSPLNSVYLHPLPAYWLELSPSDFVSEWFAGLLDHCHAQCSEPWAGTSLAVLSPLLDKCYHSHQKLQMLKNIFQKPTAIQSLQPFSSNNTPPIHIYWAGAGCSVKPYFQPYLI